MSTPARQPPPPPQPTNNSAEQTSLVLSQEDPHDPWAVRACIPKSQSFQPWSSESDAAHLLNPGSGSSQVDGQDGLDKLSASQESLVSEVKTVDMTAASSRYLSADEKKQVALRLRSSRSGHEYRSSGTVPRPTRQNCQALLRTRQYAGACYPQTSQTHPHFLK